MSLGWGVMAWMPLNGGLRESDGVWQTEFCILLPSDHMLIEIDLPCVLQFLIALIDHRKYLHATSAEVGPWAIRINLNCWLARFVLRLVSAILASTNALETTAQHGPNRRSSLVAYSEPSGTGGSWKEAMMEDSDCDRYNPCNLQRSSDFGTFELPRSSIVRY